MELNARQVDWQEEFEDWDLTCPVCEGTGRKSWDVLDADEKKEVKEEHLDMKLIDETSSDDKPTEEEIEDELKICYNADREKFDFHCDCCQEGTLEMYWNTVWDIGYSTFSENAVSREKQILIETKTACHIVYNTKDGTWNLTLSGCGMDLTPDLCYAFKLIGFHWLPTDWAHNLDRKYTGNLSEKQHEELIKFAIESLKSDCSNIEAKIKQLKGGE